MVNRTLDGLVSAVFPPHSFTYPDDGNGLRQSYIMSDELAKRLGCSIWKYKITAWNKQAANLNMVPNKTYRFRQCKLKSGMTSNKSYPTQAEFEVHLLSFSSVVELIPAIM